MRPATSDETTYASVLARARALGLFAVVTIAPLGCLTGTVVACGGARPAQPRSVEGPPGFAPPPMETIAPPAPSSSAPPPANQP